MQDYIDKSFTYAVLYQSINHKHMQDYIYTTNHAHAILSQSIIYICAEPYPDPLSHPNDISLLDLVHQQKRSDECANAKSTNTRRHMCDKTARFNQNTAKLHFKNCTIN